MRVLGIDPGVAITGYGVLDEQGQDYVRVVSGCIRTSEKMPMPRRLEIIYDQIIELNRLYRPDALSLEQLFFSKNTRTALQVGEARGIVILAAAKSGVELHQYTPLQVKQAVAGYGRAAKEQVQKMVQMLLKLEKLPAVDDEADALAVALCHLQHRRWQEAIKRGAGR